MICSLIRQNTLFSPKIRGSRIYRIVLCSYSFLLNRPQGTQPFWHSRHGHLLKNSAVDSSPVRKFYVHTKLVFVFFCWNQKNMHSSRFWYWCAITVQMSLWRGDWLHNLRGPPYLKQRTLLQLEKLLLPPFYNTMKDFWGMANLDTQNIITAARGNKNTLLGCFVVVPGTHS